jgi:hypothetical protein
MSKDTIKVATVVNIATLLQTSCAARSSPRATIRRTNAAKAGIKVTIESSG